MSDNVERRFETDIYIHIHIIHTYTWCYPDLPEPATEGRNNCTKIGDHEI